MPKRPAKKTTVNTGSASPASAGDPKAGLMAQDIVFRSAGRLIRHTLERGLLSRKLDRQEAKRIVENRSLFQSLFAYGVTKIATRSVPGAALVGGSILAKTLFDRRRAKHKSAKVSDQPVQDQAED